MRRLLLLMIVGCGSEPGVALEPRTFEFGPFELGPGREDAGQCVSASLDNDEAMFINSVELATQPGFHHSNWFWVPEHFYSGPDGAWRCGDREYDEATAGLQGGVLFAQSTQSIHEVQAFDDGVAIVIPPRSKIVAGTHLLNPSDEPRTVPLALTITPIANPTTRLSGMAFQNVGLAIPPQRASRFTMECDVGGAFDATGYSRDYNLHYVLPHYHEHGTGIVLESIDAGGTATTIFQNTSAVGDALGKTLSPVFPMATTEKLRFSCNYENTTDRVIRWGNGNGEMCVFLAFTDSPHPIAGGLLLDEAPIDQIDRGDFVELFHTCSVVVSEARED